MTALLPRGAPLHKSTFLSTYDSTFSRPITAPEGKSSLRASWNDTGHVSNMCLPLQQPKNFEETTSTSHRVHSYDVNESSIGVSHVKEVAFGAATDLTMDHVVATAQVRNQPHNTSGNTRDISTPLSTMKSSYADTFRCQVNGAGSFRYPGSAATRFNRGFLEVLDPPPGRRPQHIRCDTAPMIPKRTPQDGLHITVNPPNPYLAMPLPPTLERKMRTEDPVAYHTYKNQRPWVTQSMVYGDEKTIQRQELAKTQVSEATHADLVSTVDSKRSLLRLLAGQEPSDTRPNTSASRMGGMVDTMGLDEDNETNPIQLPQKHGEKSRVSKRIEYEGHVHQPMSRSMHTNQWHLPEPKERRQRLADTKRQLKITLSKHQVSMKASAALDSLYNVDGSMVATKPDGVHPSTWTLLKRREKKDLGDQPDPYSHKHRK